MGSGSYVTVKASILLPSGQIQRYPRTLTDDNVVAELTVYSDALMVARWVDPLIIYPPIYLPVGVPASRSVHAFLRLPPRLPVTLTPPTRLVRLLLRLQGARRRDGPSVPGTVDFRVVRKL
jgi:hypothetical protein